MLKIRTGGIIYTFSMVTFFCDTKVGVTGRAVTYNALSCKSLHLPANSENFIPKRRERSYYSEFGNNYENAEQRN